MTTRWRSTATHRPGSSHWPTRSGWTPIGSPFSRPLSPRASAERGRKDEEGLSMRFVKARGTHFYCEEQGDGPPILLIPPAGSTASTWGALVGDLAGAGRVIAYDRRGYTRSGGEVVRSAAEHTRDAAAILEALEAGPAAVIGTSAGATIALD